jgi:hypothetical protein
MKTAILICLCVGLIACNQAPSRSPEEEARIDSLARARTDIALRSSLEEKFLSIGPSVERFGLSEYSETADGALSAAAEIGRLQNLITAALADSAFAVRAKKWKKDLVKKQIASYPALRKRWAMQAKEKLWREDIDVSLSGAGNTTLTFVGAIFAANKNKEDMQANMDETFSSLRFKRINYKWYSGEDRYLYYTLHTPKDSDL